MNGYWVAVFVLRLVKFLLWKPLKVSVFEYCLTKFKGAHNRQAAGRDRGGGSCHLAFSWRAQATNLRISFVIVKTGRPNDNGWHLRGTGQRMTCPAATKALDVKVGIHSTTENEESFSLRWTQVSSLRESPWISETRIPHRQHITQP
jgi:hypothetical protein